MNEHLENTPTPAARTRVSEAAGDLRLPNADRTKAVLEILLEHPLVMEPLVRLSQQLPGDLKYHDFAHTVNVMYRAVSLGLHDGLSEGDITLLAIAAAWHDTGFIEQRQQNEPIAARWAKEAMERHGRFGAQEIDDVVVAILDTQIKFDAEHKTLVQRSTGRLSPWLLDADLDNFGAQNFLKKSLQVFGEFSGRDVSSPADLNNDAGRAYIASTIRLVAQHRWHSNAARETLTTQEQINLGRLGVLLAELTDGTDAGRNRAWNNMMGRDADHRA